MGSVSERDSRIRLRPRYLQQLGVDGPTRWAKAQVLKRAPLTECQIEARPGLALRRSFFASLPSFWVGWKGNPKDSTKRSSDTTTWGSSPSLLTTRVSPKELCLQQVGGDMFAMKHVFVLYLNAPLDVPFPPSAQIHEQGYVDACQNCRFGTFGTAPGCPSWFVFACFCKALAKSKDKLPRVHTV